MQYSINRCISRFEFSPSTHSKAMQLLKLPIVVLVFMVIRCPAEIRIATPRLAETSTSLVEDLVKIVTSCYGDNIGYGVGFAGNLPETLVKTLSARHVIPVVLIDGAKKLYDADDSPKSVSRKRDRVTVQIRFRHKLSVFVIEGSSKKQLSKIVLPNILSTIWHNKMASYFILDRSPGCVNSQDFLFLAYKLGIRNFKVMCYHYKSERIIMTYNPFMDKAPLSWQRYVNEYNSYPFVTFSRKYGAHEAICVDLDFDITNDLGGLVITVEGRPPGINARAAKTLREYQFWSENDRVVTTIYRALNITPDFTLQAGWDECIDVAMSVEATMILDRPHLCSSTYPREQLEMVIVSQFRTRESQSNTIRPVIDIDSRFGVGIISSIAPFFFRLLFVHQPLSSAFLRLIRITCNMDFTNLHHSNAARIYLVSLLLFAITVQGMYQGYLACLLTTRIPIRNVETMADVAEWGYSKIYGDRRDLATIRNPELEKLFGEVYNVYDCITYVKRNPLSVCIWPAMVSLRDLAQEFDLHVSGESVESRYIAFEIRRDWSLEQRVNVIIGKLAEAGLLRHPDIICSPEQLAHFRLTNSQSNTYMKNNNFEKMTLRELSFAFVILSIGLACATVTLLAELAIRYKCRIVRRQIINGHV